MAQKIDSLLDVGKISSEIEIIAKKMSEEFGRATNLSTFTAGGVGVGNTKEFDAMKKQIADLEAKIKQYNNAKQQQLTIEQKVAKQAFDSKAKWEAIANSTSKNIDVLTRMTAQMKVQEAVMKNNYNPQLEKQNALYTEAAAKHAVLQKEYLKTSQATGVMGRQSLSAYGGTFQLTQIMRELPNFAIDARIGFMALSNNLPMLIDSFKLLAERVDDTGKKLGNVGALKQFMKSLLSLNTIMVVASTLLVLFGDDIIEVFTGKIPPAQKAMDEFIKSIKSANSEFSTANKKFFEVSAILDSASKGFISQKDAIDEYNKAFGDTNGKVKTFEEAQKRIVEQTPNYVTAMGMLAYANSLLQEAINEAANAEANRADKQVGFWKKSWDVVKTITSDQFIFGDIAKKGGLLGFALTGGMTLSERKKEAEESEKNSKDLFEKYKTQYAKFAEFAKNNKIDIWGDNNKNKSKGSVQTGKDIYIEQKFYDEERIKLVKKLASVELGTQEEVTKGLKNTIAERREATEKQYKYTEELAKLDMRLELKKIAEKSQHDLTEIDKSKKHNDALFEKGKISKKRHLELEQQYNVALTTIMTNARVDSLNAQDDYYKKKHDAALRSAQLMIEIQAQEYSNNAAIADRGTTYNKSQISTKSKAEQGDLSKMTTGQLLGKAFGAKTDNNYLKLESERKYQAESIQAEINAERLKLGAFKGTQEQREESLKKIAALERQNAEEGSSYQIKMTEMIEQEKQDIQVQMLQQSFELMKTITDEFFKYQEDKIDEQLERDTKINEERLKQYEDETKAGIHSQEELSDFKERNTAYQESLDAEAARKKEELERNKFLLDQALALGNVAMMTALGAVTYGANPITAPLVPWIIALGAVQAALIAAQTIPAFKDGVDDFAGGKAILGDGYKHELAVSPKGMFISDNTPKLYDLDPHTTVFPDVNKVNLSSLLALRQVGVGGFEKRDDRLMRELIGAVKKQKQGNFYGMPLIRQMNMAETYSKRKRGLMN